MFVLKKQTVKESFLILRRTLPVVAIVFQVDQDDATL